MKATRLDGTNTLYGSKATVEGRFAHEDQEWSETSRVSLQRYSGAHRCHCKDVVSYGEEPSLPYGVDIILTNYPKPIPLSEIQVRETSGSLLINFVPTMRLLTFLLFHLPT